MHLWVFRARDEAGAFLEFTEGKDDAQHRRHGPADAEAVSYTHLTLPTSDLV